MNKFFKIAKPLTATQFRDMMQMQDQLNSRLHPNWKDQGWYLNIALADECMELLGHLGWKWWKDTASYKQGVTDKNLRQCQLELVDMLHFMLSSELIYQHRTGELMEDRADQLANFFESAEVMCKNQVASGDPVVFDPIHYTLLVLSDVTSYNPATGQGEVNGEAFYALLCIFGFDGDDIFNTYLGKYCLNKFRWANGYDDGSYLKNWLVPEVSALYQEDNWYLELILEDFKTHSIKATEAKIMQSLQSYYDRVTGKNTTRH